MSVPASSSGGSIWPTVLKGCFVVVGLLCVWMYTRQTKPRTAEELGQIYEREKGTEPQPKKQPLPERNSTDSRLVHQETKRTDPLVRGRDAMERGDLDSALSSLDEAIRKNPNCAEAFYFRSIVYGNKGDRVRSLADHEEAIRLKPSLAKEPPR